MVVAIVAAALLMMMPLPSAGAQPETDVTPLVRLPFPQDDGSLTPYTFELGYSLLTLIYDTLMWRDAGGVPQPWLARSVDVSPDGLEVTIRLDEEARWHDGTPVTSADVAFTFELFAERPHLRFTPQLAAIEAVETPDPQTVVVQLAHPSLGFPDQPLSDVPILPSHLWEDLPSGSSTPEGLAVGSGPYRLTDYRPGESYRFEANADYFRGPPAVTTIEVPFITDAEETLRALERRAVDMIPVSLPEDVAARVSGLGINTAEGPSYLGTVLLFNLRRPPFDDPEVRRAVAAALDLRRLAGVVGTALPADRGYIHPASEWASEEAVHVVDEDGAAARLARLDLPALEILAPQNDPVKAEAGRQVALALERAGLEAEVQELSREEMARALGEDGSTPSFEAAISTAPPLASYDPNFLGQLFGSAGEDTPLNRSGYASEAFDELVERIAAAPGPEARQAAVNDALLLLAADVPAVPLFFADGAYVYRPAVYDGWVFIKGTGILDKRSFVEPAAGPPDSPGLDAAAPPAAPEPESTPTSSGFPFGLLALGLLATAGVVLIIDLIRRRT